VFVFDSPPLGKTHFYKNSDDCYLYFDFIEVTEFK